MATMARLQCRSGTVRRIDRVTTPWRGAHGEPITSLDLGGIPVRYEGVPSVGVGDLVTVVGYQSTHGMHAQALRNESTDVSYAPPVWPAALTGTVLLGAAAPLLGFPGAFVMVPLGAVALLRGLQQYRVRWLLDSQPSRHGAPVRVPHPAMDRARQR
jgi:hypothetical protein